MPFGGLLLLQTIVHQLVGLKAISINSNSRRRNERSQRKRERGRWKLDRIRDEMESLLSNEVREKGEIGSAQKGQSKTA